MDKTVKLILESQGFNCDEYSYIERTADNIKIKHLRTGKVVDVRW